MRGTIAREGILSETEQVSEESPRSEDYSPQVPLLALATAATSVSISLQLHEVVVNTNPAHNAARG